MLLTTCFVQISNLSLGEHGLYIGNSTNSAVFGVGDYKIVLEKHVSVFLDVLYAPTIRMLLVFVPILDVKGYDTNYYLDI